MEDLTGKTFGMLKVLKRVDDYKNNGRKYPVWECLCECGKIKNVRQSSLVYGETKSCGCLIYKTNPNARRNNLTLKRLCDCWNGMMQRCYNTNSQGYKNYGGRGIKICEEWHDREKFIEWALKNGYSNDLSIDRIDVNGNYEPDNCRWVDWQTQCDNKRNSIVIEINGGHYTLKQLSQISGISRNTLYFRYSKGMRSEDILKGKKRKKKIVQKKERNGLKLNIDGVEHTIVEWSKITGVKRSTIYNRYLSGKVGADLIKKARVKIR